MIKIFDDRNPFPLHEQITLTDIITPVDIESNKDKECLYVSDHKEKCIWRIIKETDNSHTIIKWLTTKYHPLTISASSDGQLLVVDDSSSMLMIYGSDAEFIRSVQLKDDIRLPRHAVETSTGNLIIIHELLVKEKEEVSGSSGSERETLWVASELTKDGQMVIRRSLPSIDLWYLSLDSDDQVFVADEGSHRVVLLDSNLIRDRILCPTTEEEETTSIPDPWRLCYDEERKQLIVGGGLGVNVYTLSRK